ncbi:sensor histidine kinase [Pseudarthrobacter sp. MM222]|uniref:sensor histidine kinase n=1 Tax=Pseudarthrobacter sp. MM222 TaxID=3018929 RepID=UPI00221EFBF1|nr:ATP-binding protein [Pseudarthrobacter sp. MM222]CAI3801610.1 Adaptive-response sensory-kinase SasA [Pseudarthrobacter sp. MM222]
MRWRLIGAFMLITFLVVLVQDIPLGNYLVRVERDRITTSLERDAFLLGGRSADALKAGGPFPSEVAADVRRYGQASGARVVVVDAAGTAVATSDDDQSATGSVYSSRPEIAAALTGQINAGQRYSQSLGQELLYVSVPVLSGESISGAVRLSYPASVVSDQVEGQLRSIWSVAATTVLLAGILAFFMARAVTRRLQQLRTATELLADGNLDTRTEEGVGAPELRTLAAAFNRMADRLKHLLEQQRGFASDASHQLRTPLTGLRLRLENALDAIPTDPGAARTMVAASLEETYRLQRIIDGLLLLSRAEGQSLAPVRINLSDVLRTRKEQWDDLAEETGVRISLVAPPAAHILVLPGAAEQIIDNLIDNALAVAPAGSQVQLVVARGEQPGITELHVLDEGPGLSPEDCQRAFNRFWRGTAGSEGTGLGLSVVRQLAQASGATAALAPRTLEPATGATGLDACVKFRTSA